MQSPTLKNLALRATFLLILLTPAAIGAPAIPPQTQDGAASAMEIAIAGPQEAAAEVPATPADAPQLLDEQELAELAALDEEPGDEVIGGALSNQHLTYIAIALAAAVVVLVLQ